MNKNQYHVIIVYSSHNNFTYAEANRDQQIAAGKDARIFYRGHEVKKDVKRTKLLPEGI